MLIQDQQYFLGVDIGSTKSHALIADRSGRAVGFGISGGGNWEGVGWERAQRALQECVQMAVGAAGIQLSQIVGAGLGIAGYDWDEEREDIHRMVESIGLSSPFTVVNDTIVGLLAGADAGWGVVVVSGTGTNCRGWDAQGREGRVTGIGSIYGEYGGAIEIVNKAIQAVALAWTRRAPATLLSQVFLKHTGAKSVEDLLAGIVRGRYQVSPDSAPLVFRTACDGDPVAEEIIHWAARELADMAVGVIRQLDLENKSFDVVLSGSTFNGSTTMKKIMETQIGLVAPQARLIRLDGPPVIGGVLLGMEQAGIDLNGIRQTLIETTNKLQKSSFPQERPWK
jgi:N-acetylglucosamine kinase-like BadF-type ATPase